MITIDGSTLEGGGQLTRLTLSLAAITRTSVRVHSIRAGRAPSRRPGGSSHGARDRDRDSKKGRSDGKGRDRDREKAKNGGKTGGSTAGAGLKDSHLAALDFLADQCNARVEGAEVGSSEVVFRPTALSAKRTTLIRKMEVDKQKEYHIELKKPGSVWLIFQAVFPYLVFGTDWEREASIEKCEAKTKAKIESEASVSDEIKLDSLKLDDTNKSAIVADEDDSAGTMTLRLHGGTNVPSAMTTEYMTQVFLPVARKIGLPRVSVHTIKRGWAGNAPEIGEVEVKIHPPPPENLVSDNGDTGRDRKKTRFVLPAFNITDRGAVTQIDITILASPPSLRATILDLLHSHLSTSSTFPSSVSLHTLTSESSDDDRRLYILLVAHTSNGWRLGRDWLGGGASRSKNERDANRKTEEGVIQVVRGLETEARRGGCVDEHMRDQLVAFQALARGVSRVEGRAGPDTGSGREGVEGSGGTENGGGHVEDRGGDNINLDERGNEVHGSRLEQTGDETGTLHARTVRWVCETMLEDHGVKFEEGGVCRGIGWNGRGRNRPGDDMHGGAGGEDEEDEEGQR